MTRKIVRKLNHFLVSAPSGAILTSAWLEEHGVSSRLAWWYVHTGLLERIGSKAYRKAGDNVTWAGAVAALQNQLHLPLHVGGKTALQLLGRAHFLPLQGQKEVILFTSPQTITPNWLTNSTLWKTRFSIVKTSLFTNESAAQNIIERSIEGISVQLSCPERAAMEMLYRVPKYQLYEEAVSIMENLGQLRPDVVQTLLENCNSVKVKRLFLYLSEKFKHVWFSNLNLNKINLGSGKRVIAKGGKYDSKYLLSVPIISEEENELRSDLL